MCLGVIILKFTTFNCVLYVSRVISRMKLDYWYRHEICSCAINQSRARNATRLRNVCTCKYFAVNPAQIARAEELTTTCCVW